MVEHKLCPLCATENLMSLPFHEGELFPASLGGREIVGQVFLSRCERGHVLLRIATENNPSQPSWEINILGDGVDQNIAGEKWFGKFSRPEQAHADCRLSKFAVALEAMSQSIEHIQRLVRGVWESSISQEDSEYIPELESVGVSEKGEGQ